MAANQKNIDENKFIANSKNVDYNILDEKL
jgi:hypothetical protein